MTKPVTLPSGITLHVDIAGDAAHPIIIPIIGITDNITDWPPPLTDPLVAAGYRVVRFELRDMGHSSKLEQAGVPNLDQVEKQLASGQIPQAAYTMHDVAGDVLQLMDALAIEQAHLIGYSYGAAIAQLATLAAPDRVLSMTCLQGTNYNPALSPRRDDAADAAGGAGVCCALRVQREVPIPGGRNGAHDKAGNLRGIRALDRTACPLL